ncbi:HlyD family type I secretion periplasmic adaptor subunit [Sulfurospirillum arcachonense]|uniref:HlyD family type I secretion periplasmic adaptor subunit n=1 Tax=Sulfurospirillum arcachonense TaxID=57666 RepID=UPI0004684988|nr:HlyD family type I secretion periplasmic adaptor subunit [Sulfurospirillum arcachonense]
MSIENENKAINTAQNLSRVLKKDLHKSKFDVHDLKYMSSLSEAVLQKSPRRSKYILWLIALSIGWLIFWASQAELDELTRGEGKIIPSHQLQVVQNLEGGIVSDILIKEGDIVKQGQVILKINNTNFASSYEEGKLKLDELKAKFLRLDAEANELKSFNYDKTKTSKQIEYEKSLYDSNKEQLTKSLDVIKEQITQKNQELSELYAKIKQEQNTLKLMEEEVAITEPLVKRGLVSEVEFLQLRRQLNGVKGDLEASTLSIPRLKSQIIEFNNKISEIKLEYKNKAKEELNKVVAEISRITETNTALSDRVKRTLVRSPVDGTVQQLFINTIGGVIQPGMDLVEIVPAQDTLLVEAKIKPSDIAFLRPHLDAMVKFSAYDFAIHGGLNGKVTNISADTIKDEKDESYYQVRIKTDKNHLGSEEKPLPIIVGMTVSVDIITGKKTVLDYLLKPILKAKQSALRER